MGILLDFIRPKGLHSGIFVYMFRCDNTIIRTEELEWRSAHYKRMQAGSRGARIHTAQVFSDYQGDMQHSRQEGYDIALEKG